MGEGIQVIEELDMAFGIDFRIRRPFRFSLLTGNLEFLSNPGRGPGELSIPSQITVKNSREFYVYDTSQDMIAYFVDDQIVGKLPGYTRKNIWLRNPYGQYWKNSLFTPIKDPQRILAMDFDQAKPIARFHL
ncbi:MAG: hypothetical protein EA364_05260 [Balneolaceae bacterium]|nr:MAG: hypothetical protein EA364_05260 [Balneolaceae bacterium]